MQLGTRWNVGSTPPDGLPEVVGIALGAVEDDLQAATTDTAQWRWTLTWLESKPVIELDDGTIIRYNDADDSASITMPSVPSADDDEDW